MTFIKLTTAALAMSAVAPAPTQGGTSLQTNVRAAADQLMYAYDKATGLWNNDKLPLWWQSANMMTAMIDVFKIDPVVQNKYGDFIDITYALAPANNPHYTRASPNMTHVSKRDVDSGNGFLNGYYDDEGWWAMAWIAAYDLTKNNTYLTTAEQIWSDMSAGTTAPCGDGGIWWDKKQSVVASIANELFMATSAALALRVNDSSKAQYIDAATASIEFMRQTELIGFDGLVVDTLDSKCTPIDPTYTYNQGVILGGLVDLARVTQNASYVSLAIRIADAAIGSNSPLVTNGILHEFGSCNETASCRENGAQFKGIFVRNLRQFALARPGNRIWADFLIRNAHSIWYNDRFGRALFGPNWAGPFDPSGASTQAQCSAMECLSAAEAVLTGLNM